MRVLLFAFLTLVSFTLYGGGQTPHPQHKLLEVSDFTAEATLARQGKTPIMLLVSQEHCSFCDQIKRDILYPMLASGDYDGRLLIREIVTNLGSRVIDFKGQLRDSGTFVLDYKAYLTPTLLFLDAEGNELSERIVGIQTPELFPFYVERAIEDAIVAFPGRD